MGIWIDLTYGTFRKWVRLLRALDSGLESQNYVQVVEVLVIGVFEWSLPWVAFQVLVYVKHVPILSCM